ncbi:MAG: hypothetical protein ACKV2U_13980 [Bryobacteraceae bacterium]
MNSKPIARRPGLSVADDATAHLCNRWADFFLSGSENAEFASGPERDKQEWKLDRVRPHPQPLWFYRVSLCQALQEGENELTAKDAYWLGLVDEVIGASHLPSMRFLVEFESAA